MIKQRRSGVLLHITSLPSRFGIGNLGNEAYRFADFMQRAGLTYWQILPLNPVDKGSGFSPYSGLSAFAGNPLLISPDLLVKDRLLAKKDIADLPSFDEKSVEFDKVVPLMKSLLDQAFQRFTRSQNKSLRNDYETFCTHESDWLDDFADYMAFKHHFEFVSWDQWPAEIRDREPLGMDDLREKVKDVIEQTKFEQFIFFRQWNNLKQYCEEKGVQFFGDIPFYVGYDSSDVWAHQDIFKLKRSKKSKAVAGVPPDYFSKTGQLWGMPVFDWKSLKKKKYHWWVHRISHNFDMFGLIRLDHFRAFSAYWEVPAKEDTAINGQWKKGPRAKIFKRLQKKYQQLNIIAEDLGDIDQDVYDLMEKFDFPGMKVLHFALGDNMPQSGYIPHHHQPNAVVYTGTHDNNTTLGWFKDLSAADRRRLSDYLQQKVTSDNVAWMLMTMAMRSVCRLCVVPMQDFLNLGEEAIMNRPSTATGNWLWRMSPKAATLRLARKIDKINVLYDRHPLPVPVAKKKKSQADSKANPTASATGEKASATKKSASTTKARAKTSTSTKKTTANTRKKSGKTTSKKSAS